MSQQVRTRRASKSAAVLVIEDHPLYRFALESALERDASVRLAGSAADAEEGVILARKLRPDVVLLDLHLPGRDGLSILGELRCETPAPRVLLLTADEDPGKIAAALRGGAVGYLSKEIDKDGLIRAVVAAARGETVITRRLQGHLLGELCRPPATQTPLLSEREREILARTAVGESRRQIADALFLSPSTVKAHLSGIYVKLGVSDRAAAVARGIGLGLLALDDNAVDRWEDRPGEARPSVGRIPRG